MRLRRPWRTGRPGPSGGAGATEAGPAVGDASPSGRISDEVRFVTRIMAGIAAAVVLVSGLSAGWILCRVSPRVQQLQSASRQLDLLHASMVDEETGIRGYLATGSTDFLQPYFAALPVVDGAEHRLAGLLPSGPMWPQFVALEQARQQWADQWAGPATAGGQPSALGPQPRQSSGDLTAVTQFMTTGKVLFDAYRQTHDTLATALNAEVRAGQTEEWDWLLGCAVALAAISAGTVAASAVAHRRITGRIARPVEDLAAAVSSLAGRDPGTLLVEGPREIVALGKRIFELALALRGQAALASEREAQATRHSRQLDVVLGAARDVAGSLSLRYVLGSVATAVAQLGYSQTRIWLLEEADHRLLLCYDSAAGPQGPATPAAVAVGAGAVGRCARYARPTGPEPTDAAEVTTTAVPLVLGGRVVGVLEGLRSSPATAEDLPILEALAGHASGAITAAQLHEQVSAQAVTDALTALPNRRAFDDLFGLEVRRALRYGRPLSLISIDLDHFKRLNDRFGHAYGDTALQQAAEVLRGGIRDSDRVFRLGGEELAVVCPETTAADAVIVAERLRRAVEHSAGPSAARVTASFGVAELPGDASDADGLLAAADRALYRAKRDGRNRVAVCQGDTVPASQHDGAGRRLPGQRPPPAAADHDTVSAPPATG